MKSAIPVPRQAAFAEVLHLRMRQVYETYRGDKKVAPLVRQLSWTHHLVIMGQCKRAEERDYFPTQTGIPNQSTDRRRAESVIPAEAGIHSAGSRVNERVVPATLVPEYLNRGAGIHSSSRTCQDNRRSTSLPVCGMVRCTSA